MGDKELKSGWRVPLYGVVGAVTGFVFCMWLALSKAGEEPNLIGQVIGQALLNVIPGCSDVSFVLCMMFAIGGAIGGASIGLTLAYLKEEENKDKLIN